MSSVGQICTLNCSKCPPPYSFQCRLSILSFFVQYNEKRIKLGAPRAIGEVASNICCNFECMISANPNFSFFLAHMLPKELFVFLKNVQETLKNRVCTGRWSPHIKQWELREAFFVHWSIFAEKSSDMSSIPALSLGEVIQISLPWENLNFIEGLASCCKCKNTARKWFLTCDPDEMLHHLMVYSPEVWGHGQQFPALKCIGIRSSQGKTGPFTQYICHGISLSLLTSFHLHGERIDTTWPWSWWGQAMPICKYWCCWMGSQIMTLGCSLQHLVHYQSLGSNAEMVQLQKLHPQPNPKRPVCPWTSSLSSSRSPTQWCLEQVLLKESLHSILSEIRNQNMYDK